MSTDWPGGFYTYEDPETSAVRAPTTSRSTQREAGRFIYSGCHTFAILLRSAIVPRRSSCCVSSPRASRRRSKPGSNAPARSDSLGDARSEAPAGSLAERRWGLLEEAQEAALIPPKHENYPAVEDAIWQVSARRSWARM